MKNRSVFGSFFWKINVSSKQKGNKSTKYLLGFSTLKHKTITYLYKRGMDPDQINYKINREIIVELGHLIRSYQESGCVTFSDNLSWQVHKICNEG